MSLKDQLLAAAEQVLASEPAGLTVEALARQVAQRVGRQMPPRQVADALRSTPERFLEGGDGRWRSVNGLASLPPKTNRRSPEPAPPRRPCGAAVTSFSTWKQPAPAPSQPRRNCSRSPPGGSSMVCRRGLDDLCSPRRRHCSRPDHRLDQHHLRTGPERPGRRQGPASVLRPRRRPASCRPQRGQLRRPADRSHLPAARRPVATDIPRAGYAATGPYSVTEGAGTPGRGTGRAFRLPPGRAHQADVDVQMLGDILAGLQNSSTKARPAGPSTNCSGEPAILGPTCSRRPPAASPPPTQSPASATTSSPCCPTGPPSLLRPTCFPM